jgi:hypothetical protein
MRPFPKLITSVAIFVFFFALAAASQWRAGAFRAEFGADPDEPAHYVTGLLVHDYITSGMPRPMMSYAENYYLHYPKVALGHWPPLFYVVQAAWTLPFSVSRTSVLLLMAAIVALFASVFTEMATRQFSLVAGIAAGLLLLSLHQVRAFSLLVMSDILTALLVLLALRSFGRYFDDLRWQDAAWFGFWAALATLTKATGLVVALVPPLAILLSGRYLMIRRASFWLPAVIVFAFCAPWYLYISGARHEAVAHGAIGAHYSRLWETLGAWILLLGPVLAVLAVVGIAIVYLDRRRSKRWEGIWLSGFCLLISAIVFRVAVGAWEPRHLMATAPTLLLFAIAGAKQGVSWIVPGSAGHRVKAVALLLPLAALCIWNVRDAPRLAHHGFTEVANDLLAESQLNGSAVLISSFRGEGMFVSEVAMHDRRPNLFVVRASKLFARISWMGDSYEPLVHSPEEVQRLLLEIPVSTVVIDRSEPNPRPDQGLLVRAMEMDRDRWELIRSYPRAGVTGDAIQVYRLRGANGSPVRNIRVDLTQTLHRFVELK